MFQGKNVLEIINLGGITMYILLFCSVISLAAIINRLFVFHFYGLKIKRSVFMQKIRNKLAGKDIAGVTGYCENLNSPFAKVVLAGLAMVGKHEKEMNSNIERAIAIEVINLEKYTGIVGTIGNIAVYIGLFGTVLGIIRAFHDIATIGQGGINVVILGVSEALITTAAGLAVAIPAVVAYNYFLKRIEYIFKEMQLCASELLDFIGNY